MEREKYKTEEKHQDLYQKEKRKADDLQAKIVNYQKMIGELKNQIESYKKAHESNMKTLSTLEEKLSHANADKKELEDKFRSSDSNYNQLRYEVDHLKQKNHSQQLQLQQLQDSLTNTELKHK
jgi:chromosome segregation ATPase